MRGSIVYSRRLEMGAAVPPRSTAVPRPALLLPGQCRAGLPMPVASTAREQVPRAAAILACAGAKVILI